LWSQGEAIFFLGNYPFLGGRVKAKGERIHVGVLNLSFHGSCKLERIRRPKSSDLPLEANLRWRQDGIMDSSKFGVMKCFVEDVAAR